MAAHFLNVWAPGETLTAIALNSNFATLRDLASEALAAALTPDPVAVTAEVAVTKLRRRLDALERLARMRERQRNEKEWTPLAYHGAILRRLDDLQAQVERAVDRIEELYSRLAGQRDDLHARVLRVEQQPEAAPKEDLTALLLDHNRVALEGDAMGRAMVELRHEVGVLHDWMLGTDQRVNRVQYAPLAYVGELLRRVERLEAANDG